MRHKVEYSRDGANIVARIYGPDFGAVYDDATGYDRWRIETAFTGSNLGWLYDRAHDYLRTAERLDALRRIESDLNGTRSVERRGW